ncbi:hypothetical protein [Ilumatobacter sp.]|uniref:hypothetical protein n=1 Tax=Ilumatobacter sp. TaxID=1967498 RepID=UPI003B52C6C0
MELRRRTWSAAVKLATVLSVVAASVTLVALRVGDVPAAALIAPVATVAFVASWIQTGRIQRRAVAEVVVIGVRTPTRTA